MGIIEISRARTRGRRRRPSALRRKKVWASLRLNCICHEQNKMILPPVPTLTLPVTLPLFRFRSEEDYFESRPTPNKKHNGRLRRFLAHI